VILEDLDALEAHRRLADLPPEFVGSVRDPRIWRRLRRYVTPYVPGMFLALVLSMISAFAAVVTLYVLMGVLRPMFEAGGRTSAGEHALQLVHRFVEQAPTLVDGGWHGVVTTLGDLARLGWDSLAPLLQLRWAAIFLVLLVSFEQANKYGQKLLMRAVALELVSDIRIDLYDKILKLSMRFFHANHSGRLLSRITNDLTKLGNLLVDVMVNWFTDVFTVVGSLWFVWTEGGPAVIVGLFIASISFAPVQQLGRRIRNREQKNQREMADLFLSLSESLSAPKIVKAFNAQEHELQRFRSVNARFTAGRMKAAELSARTEPMVEVLGAIAVALFLFLGGRRVLEGTADGATFFAIIAALFKTVSSLRRLGDTSTKMQGGLSSSDRIATLLFSKPEIVDKPDAVRLQAFERAIAFEHVDFSHEESRKVLDDIDFVLEKGHTVALVGHTGSGKSTVGDLLLRFYDVDAGAVRVDGHDVRDLELSSLRDQMAVVTQETVLFEGTIASNIAYAMPQATQADIERVAVAAHAHEFILRQPQGYQTWVGERGTTLSGGERQRIAIARALLRDKPILVLDEATSALDTQSEQIVQEAIERLMQGRTTLVIAHRLSTIRDADLILVLERGRVIERGSHAELMALEGVYSDMVRLQSAEG